MRVGEWVRRRRRVGEEEEEEEGLEARNSDLQR